MTTNQKAAADQLALETREFLEMTNSRLLHERAKRQKIWEKIEAYEAAAKERAANGWAKKNPWERIADLLGPAEATRIIAQNTPAPEKIVASAEVITLEKIRDTLAREHTAQRLRWNPDVPQWETAYDETMRLLEAAILAQPAPEAVTLEANLFWPDHDPEMSLELGEIFEDSSDGDILELRRAVSLKNAFYARADSGDDYEIVGPFGTMDEAKQYLAERANGSTPEAKPEEQFWGGAEN